MDLSIQKIYSSKLQEIQSRVPENVKLGNSFASCLETEIKKSEVQPNESSNDSSSDLKTIADLLYNNTVSSNNLFSNNVSNNNSTLNLPNYNSNIALTLALNKVLNEDK